MKRRGRAGDQKADRTECFPSPEAASLSTVSDDISEGSWMRRGCTLVQSAIAAGELHWAWVSGMVWAEELVWAWELSCWTRYNIQPHQSFCPQPHIRHSLPHHFPPPPQIRPPLHHILPCRPHHLRLPLLPPEVAGVVLRGAEAAAEIGSGGVLEKVGSKETKTRSGTADMEPAGESEVVRSWGWDTESGRLPYRPHILHIRRLWSQSLERPRPPRAARAGCHLLRYAVTKRKIGEELRRSERY